MAELKIKARISSDHKLTADVPTDVPEGVIEVVLQLPNSEHVDSRRNRALIDLLVALEHQPGRKSRTKEDIDRQIAQEREAWD